MPKSLLKDPWFEARFTHCRVTLAKCCRVVTVDIIMIVGLTVVGQGIDSALSLQCQISYVTLYGQPVSYQRLLSTIWFSKTTYYIFRILRWRISASLSNSHFIVFIEVLWTVRHGGRVWEICIVPNDTSFVIFRESSFQTVDYITL